MPTTEYHLRKRVIFILFWLPQLLYHYLLAQPPSPWGVHRQTQIIRIKTLFQISPKTVQSNLQAQASYLRDSTTWIVSDTAPLYGRILIVYRYLCAVAVAVLEFGLDDEGVHQDHGGPEDVPAREQGKIAAELEGVLGISLSSLASTFSDKWELGPEPKWHYLYVAVPLVVIVLTACRMLFMFQAKVKEAEPAPKVLVKDPDVESIKQLRPEAQRSTKWAIGITIIAFALVATYKICVWRPNNGNRSLLHQWDEVLERLRFSSNSLETSLFSWLNARRTPRNYTLAALDPNA